MSQRQLKLERAWIVVVVGYGVARSLVVWKTLANYGVNPLAYFVIDVGSSWPYGVSTARLVRGATGRNPKFVAKWGVLAAVTFILPDIYLVVSLDQAPGYIYGRIGAIVLTLGVLASFVLRRQLRRKITCDIHHY